MALNDIKVPKENAQGTFDETVIRASDGTPSALGTAAAGSATDYARADHVHSAEVSDSAFRVTGSTDATKAAKFDASAIATGTTRTITVPNKNVTLDDAGDSRAPTAHKNSHSVGQSDALAPSDIGAQSIFDTSNASAHVSGVPLQLSAARARTWLLENSASNRDVYLPVTGIQTGDVAVLIGGGTVAYTLTVKVPAAGGAAIIDPENTPSGSPVVISATGQQYRFIVTNPANFNPWRFVAVDSHTHAASAITSGTLTHERGGLEADVSAYNGLVKISGGSTSAVTVTSAGEALLDDVDAAAQRTTLGLGTAATAATGDFAAASHSHGNLTSAGAIGSTAGLPVVTTTSGAVTTLALGTANQVLRVNSGATGVEFADASGGGVTGAASSASDVLGVSGANITGVDANADRIVYWNNTSNKLAYGTPADAGAAAASHTHAASDITSGTIDTARLASGTANSGTFLRGDQTWAAAGGVTTGSVDNAIIRADGTGGSTSQGSAINIEDASTTTENNVAITNQHSGQTNSSLVLTPKGTGAFIVGPRPDGTATGGNARGAGAICIQTSRNAANQVASTADSIAIGNRSRSSSALGESIAIGFSTTASGSYATCVGGRSTATNTYCTAVGHDADATQSGALALGDRTTSSTAGGVAVGSQASATNDRGIAIGEQSSCASAYGISMGAFVSTGGVNGVSLNASSTLRAQFATLPFSAVYWSGQTTNNTATILNLDGTATNRFTIAASTALAVDILLVARRTGTQDKWLVARRFLGIRRDGSNNTSLIGTVQTLGTDQSAGSPTWTFALTADDTNEALQLEVTGATGETVEWRATAFYRVA